MASLALLLYQRRRRVQLQQAAVTEAHLRKLTLGIENSANGVMITDINGTIEYVNRKFSQVTGFSPEEAIGHNPRIMKSEATPREVFDDLWRTILSGCRMAWRAVEPSQEWRGVLVGGLNQSHCVTSRGRSPILLPTWRISTTARMPRPPSNVWRTTIP